MKNSRSCLPRIAATLKKFPTPLITFLFAVSATFGTTTNGEEAIQNERVTETNENTSTGGGNGLNEKNDEEDDASFWDGLEEMREGPGFTDLVSSRDQIYHWVNTPVTWLDKKLAGDIELEDDVLDTRFRIQPYMVYQRQDSDKFSFDLDFSSSIHLRRVEKKLKLIVETGELGALPDTSPEDEDKDTRIGLSKMIQRFVNARVGVQTKWPPVGFASLTWARSYEYGEWMVFPSSEVFYRTNDVQFGNTNNLPFGRWWGNHQFRSASGIRIAGNTDGFQWASAWNYGFAPNLIQHFDQRPLTGAMDFAKGANFMYRISGSLGDDNVITEHQTALTLRHPIRGNWLFAFAVPEIRWLKENNWDPVYRIRIGIDILFWGQGTQHWSPDVVR